MSLEKVNHGTLKVMTKRKIETEWVKGIKLKKEEIPAIEEKEVTDYNL